MATQTTNYNLSKPDSTDPFSQFRQSYNDNLDIIDANLGGGGGSGGHTILDGDGNALPQEDDLQFTGAVSVTDDNVNGKTIVDILGGNVYGAFVDTNREIASGSIPQGSSTYTATEDCALLFSILSGSNNSAKIEIDGVKVWEQYDQNGINSFSNYLFVKSGQTVTFTQSYSSSGTYKAYALIQGTNGIFAPVIYSDNERVIGVWRDNKPLYAKTIVKHSTDISGAGVSFDVSDLDIDTCVDVFGTCDRIVTGVGTLIYPFNAYEDASLRTYVAYSKFNTCINFNIRFYVGESTSTQYITILYTKNSDVAGSGDYNTYGVPTVHYSTSEQVVGTYLGKPLYQKTYSGLSISCATQGTWYSTGQNYGDIEKIISCEMIDQYGQNIRGSAGYMSLTPKPIAVNCPVDNRVITDFTISYTKTTD